MVHALSHNIEKQGIHEKMGDWGWGEEVFLVLHILKNGLDRILNSIKDFPLQEH